MATLQRVRVSMTGFPGAPGVMTFACSDVNTFIPALNTWLGSMAQWIPADVTLAVESSGDVFDSFTGEISATWNVGTQPPVTGTALGIYAAPVGFVAEWLTSVHLSGRRLRGRTFVVPAAAAIFDLTGNIGQGTLDSIRAASAALVVNSAGSFQIWQRPRLARAAVGTLPALPARSGGNGVVTSSRVPDLAAVLRSRRD